MKIVNLETLLKQTQGTLFADYHTCNVGEICVFGGPQGNGGIDFVRASLGLFHTDLPEDSDGCWMAFWLDRMEKGEEGKPDFECWGRDGLHDAEARFVILDREDVTALFKRIAKSLTQAYGVINPGDLL
jgi:hypothetical protein